MSSLEPSSSSSSSSSPSSSSSSSSSPPVEGDAGPCVVCCSVRSTTAGSLASAALGGVLALPFDLVPEWRKHKTLSWSMKGLRKTELTMTSLFLAGAVAFPSMAYFSVHNPLDNKGCDTDMPFWSWNGAMAGTLAAPFGAFGYLISRFQTIRAFTPKPVLKAIPTSLVSGFLIGGLFVQDYWRLTVVEAPWGSKCQTPHAPRYFPPAKP